MSEWEEANVLRGRVQLDDTYLAGERPGGKAGRGSENKVPIVTAVSLNVAGKPIHTKSLPVRGFVGDAMALGPGISWQGSFLSVHAGGLRSRASGQSGLGRGCAVDRDEWVWRLADSEVDTKARKNED